jgi:hypothetical protein
MEQVHALPERSLAPYTYTLPQQEAVAQCSGKRAAWISWCSAEPQILGQMKQAVRTAESAGSLGLVLNRLFQHTFAVAPPETAGRLCRPSDPTGGRFSMQFHYIINCLRRPRIFAIAVECSATQGMSNRARLRLEIKNGELVVYVEAHSSCGLEPRACRLGSRWSRTAEDVMFSGWAPDRWLQAKLFCPTRITSIIERQQLGAGFTGRKV